MPENEKEKALDKLPQAKFVAIPSKDGPLYFQVYVLCGGVWTKEPVEPSTRYSFRANDKVVLGLIGSNREAFYYKSNTDYPPHNKCIGIQLVITSVNVSTLVRISIMYSRLIGSSAALFIYMSVRFSNSKMT